MMDKLIKLLLYIFIIFCQCNVILATVNKVSSQEKTSSIANIDTSDVLLPSNLEPDITTNNTIKIAPKNNVQVSKDQDESRWKASLFFNEDQLKFIQDAMGNTQELAKGKAGNVFDYNLLPNLYLSSIIYANANQWVAIINGVLVSKKQEIEVPSTYKKNAQSSSNSVKITIKDVDANFIVLSVNIQSNSSIEFLTSKLAQVRDNVFANFNNSIVWDVTENSLTIKLHPNQSFNGSSVTIQEGY